MADIASARNVEIEVHAPEEPVVVPAQTELLAEAIANLLDNALKASPARGVVRLAVAAAPPGFSVSDDGPGIPPHRREAVFEHFVRGEQAGWPGSGLGLTIVRDIAKMHRAEVSISEADGERGTRVTFEFVSEPSS